jgi:hypothetical protein
MCLAHGGAKGALKPNGGLPSELSSPAAKREVRKIDALQRAGLLKTMIFLQNLIQIAVALAILLAVAWLVETTAERWRK